MAATLGLHIWHLAIEPASAVAFGELRRDGRALPAIGLPADPAAAMVALLCLARPILLRLMGARDLTPRRYRLRAGFAHTKDAGRRAFLPARLVPGPQSDLAAVANPAPSGRIAALLAADGLVDLPEALTRLEPGSMVDFLPFSEVA